MSRPQILFLSHVLPYPPDSGVAIRTFNILRVLSSEYDVDVLAFFRAAAHPSHTAVKTGEHALQSMTRSVEAFPIPQEHRMTRRIADHARSLVTGRPYTYYAYRSRDFALRLDARLRSRVYDVIHVDSLDLCAYLLDLDLSRVACVHHNVESALLRRRAANESRWMRRSYLRVQAALTERAERRWCPQVGLNVTVSPDDERALRALAPASRTVTVPNGVDLEFFQPAPREGGVIAFLGGTEWFPNVDALEFFGERVLPRLRERMSEVRVRWIGRATAAQQREYGRRYGIELTGYVEDIRDHLSDVACTIVPLRIGGGTRLKITTAWALGLPVVSTSIGCEGLHARDGCNILIRDAAGEFAEAVASVLQDPDRRAALAAFGRRTAEERYGWNVIGQTLVGVYRELAS